MSAPPPDYPGALGKVFRHNVLIALAITLVGLGVSVYAIVRSGATDATPAPSASSTTGDARTVVPPSTTATGSGGTEPPGATRDGQGAQAVSGECGLPSTGRAADCTAREVAVALDDVTCTASGVLGHMGLNPDLDSLDLNLVLSDRRCWVQPGQAATTAGATAADIVRAAAGSVSSRLRECARDGGRIATACSDRHEQEWVGDWWSRSPTTDSAAECRSRAARYTGMSVDGLANRIIVQVAERSADGPQVRCVVAAENVTLTDSVRNLRGSPLPTG